MPESLPPFEFRVRFAGYPVQLENTIAGCGLKVHVNRQQQPGTIRVGIRNDARLTAEHVRQVLERIEGVTDVQLLRSETHAA